MTEYLKTFAGFGGTGVAMVKEQSAKIEGSAPPMASVREITEAVEREQRIASLMERYRTGRYYTNSQSLAARIVDSHLLK